MRDKRLRGSYTIEAAIYIPIILFMMCQTLQIGLGFWQESKEREMNKKLQELNVVKEFYTYQILEEVGKELADD